MSEKLNFCIGSLDYDDLDGKKYSLADVKNEGYLTFKKFTTKSLIKLEENDKLFSLSFSISGEVIVPKNKKLVTVKTPTFSWTIKIISNQYTNQPSVKAQIINEEGLYLSMDGENNAVLTNKEGSALNFVVIEPGKLFMEDMCLNGPTEKASDLTICQNYYYDYPDPKIVSRFCTIASDIERPICQNYCKNNDCNNILEKYCGVTANKDSQYCSCFLGTDFFTTYGKSLKSNGYSPLDLGSAYYYPNCLNSSYHIYGQNIPKDADCVLMANTAANGDLISSILTKNINECYNFIPKIPLIKKPEPIFIPESKKYKKKSELVIVIPVISVFVLLTGIALISMTHRRKV